MKFSCLLLITASGTTSARDLTEDLWGVAVGIIIGVSEKEVLNALKQDKVIRIYSRTTSGDKLDFIEGEAYIYSNTYKTLTIDGIEQQVLDTRDIVFQGEEVLTLGHELDVNELDLYVFHSNADTGLAPYTSNEVNDLFSQYEASDARYTSNYIHQQRHLIRPGARC